MTRCNGNAQTLIKGEYSNLAILLKPVDNKFHNIWSVILNHSIIYNNMVKLSIGTKPHK